MYTDYEDESPRFYQADSSLAKKEKERKPISIIPEIYSLLDAEAKHRGVTKTALATELLWDIISRRRQEGGWLSEKKQ